MAVCLAVFGRTLGFGFIRLDDPAYVSENPRVSGGVTWDNLRWALTSFHGANWHPLTWISLQLDAALGGGNAAAFHATNLLLHAANALLLFQLLLWLTRRQGRSFLVAALFAIHPLHVESVAWVTERKDVLSTLFLLLALMAYSSWATRGNRSGYLLALAAMAAGLMSKPMLVSLPLVLLVWDYWPLDRLRGVGWKRALIEKAPFALLSGASSAITLFAQSAGSAVQSFDTFPIAVRMANAVVSCVRYLLKTAWPAKLALPYPYDLALLSGPRVLGAVALLVLVTVAAVRLRSRWPSLLAGWVWYLATLAPVLGIVQVGTQAMADRYTYVPLIGIFAAVAFAPVPHPASAAWWTRIAAAAAASASVAALAASAWLQTAHWQSSARLFAHAAQVAPGNAVALNVLGLDDFDAGRLSEAVVRFRTALAVSPRYPDAHANLAAALVRTGNGSEAMAHYAEALRLRPGDANAHANLAILRDQQGDRDEAERGFREALRLDPENVQARNGYGLLLARAGRNAEALPHLQGVVRDAPGDVTARLNLAAVLMSLGRPGEARGHLEEALRLAPRNARAHFSLGVLDSLEGRREEAEARFEEALRLDPENDVAREFLERLRTN